MISPETSVRQVVSHSLKYRFDLRQFLPCLSCGILGRSCRILAVLADHTMEKEDDFLGETCGLSATLILVNETISVDQNEIQHALIRRSRLEDDYEIYRERGK